MIDNKIKYLRLTIVTLSLIVFFFVMYKSSKHEEAEAKEADRQEKNVPPAETEKKEISETVESEMENSGSTEKKESKEENASESLSPEKVASPGTDQQKEGRWLEGEILPNEGFEVALLAVKGIELKHAMEISNALRFDVDLRFLRAGEKFKLKLSEDGSKVEEFVYTPDVITLHKLTRDPKKDKLVYSKKILPTEKRLRLITGKLETTLNQALIDREDVSRNVRAVTNGILECLVNFRTDARKGDRFRILVEDKYYRGERVPGSKILYSSYDGKRSGFSEAFRYEDDDPKSSYNAHYSKEGKALIHSSLRLPLDRIHVTSTFGMRRHPVTGRRAFHNGVDYGGRVGTAVYAVAKGRVIESTRTKYGGNKIILKHADGTKTYYLHLHKKLVKRGQTVKVRQVIGKVGRTGRVSGPHLHFSIKSPRGKWLDPLRKKMIATPKLKGRRLSRFKNQMGSTQSKLSMVLRFHNELEEMKKLAENPKFVGPHPDFSKMENGIGI